MAIITRENAKTNLSTGKKPDGDFFADFIDSIVFKSDDLRELFISYATQNEAQQGTENTKIMTPLRVKNALDQLKGNAPADGDTLQKLRQHITRIDNFINDIKGNNNNNILDKWNEVKRFLSGIPQNTANLITLLNRKPDAQVGDYKYSAKQGNHDGWLVCNGAAVSRSTYAQLFGVINTLFGNGDGRTTFNLPDGRGRVPIQSGTSPQLSNKSMGQKVGAEQKTLSVNELPAHNHSVTDRGHDHSTIAGVVAKLHGTGAHESAYSWRSHSQVDIDADRKQDNWDECANVKTNTSYTGISVNNTGGGQAFNLYQPSLVIGNLFIYSGVR